MPTLAHVLTVGRADINAAWPARLSVANGHDSDGWIGDTAHQAKTSDHNPDARGIVHAIDVDVDMVDPVRLLAAILRHPSTRYAIFHDRIYHVSNHFQAAHYTGVYHHHMHWSIEHATAAENSDVRLDIAGGQPARPPAGGGMTRFPVLRRNTNVVSSAVKTLQRCARTLGGTLTVDGKFGGYTRGWVLGFQHAHGLTADGVVGSQTWCAIAQALLNRFGYGLAVDGKWGPHTLAATLAFQTGHGLTADGIFGPRTLAASIG